MQQLAVMTPYVEKHLQELHEKIQNKTLTMKQHKLHFIAWLKDLNIPIGETINYLYLLFPLIIFFYLKLFILI
jgi:hypothetical protein